MRESESIAGQYSISLRFEGKVYHYRINLEKSHYYVTPEFKFKALVDLVKHHSLRPDGLITNLTYPANNPNKPPIFGVSHEDHWEINRSEIEMGKRLGGGQYGDVYQAFWKYCNRTVAVKTFKVCLNIYITV